MRSSDLSLAALMHSCRKSTDSALFSFGLGSKSENMSWYESRARLMFVSLMSFLACPLLLLCILPIGDIFIIGLFVFFLSAFAAWFPGIIL